MKRICRKNMLTAAFIGFSALTSFSGSAQTVNTVPSQFIAKMYSEAFGRAPDPGGWLHWVNEFQSNGCNLSELQNVATTFYVSASEFGTDYDSADYQARVIALYRGVLNRDPSQSELTTGVSQLSGTSWSTFVSTLLGSTDFQDDVTTICSSSTAGYGFGNTPPPTPNAVLSGPGAGYVPTSESDLQNQLNSKSSGQTLCLSQEQLIVLDSTLEIPAGVTLTTCNSPAPSSYAQMARLARGPSFPSGSQAWNPTVKVDAGGILKNVWVDGQRNVTGASLPDTEADFNVLTYGGPGTVVNYNRISEARGNAQLDALGSGLGYSCTASGSTPGVDMEYNLITAYTSKWEDAANSDGIDSYCEQSTIKNNYVIDTTDVGIIIFGMSSTSIPQASTISNNAIIQAGNSQNAPFCLDQNTEQSSGSSFQGMVMDDNEFWTSPQTHFSFGVCAGTGPWPAGPFPIVASSYQTSTGGTFTNNYTPASLSANVRDGIEAGLGTTSVAINTNTDGNHPFNVNIMNFQNGDIFANCPGGAVIADSGATGTFPAPTFEGSFFNCLDTNDKVPGPNYSLANTSWATGDMNGWMVSDLNGGQNTYANVEDAPTSGYNSIYDLKVTIPSTTSCNYAYQYIQVPSTSATFNFSASVYAETSSHLINNNNVGGFLMVTDADGQGIISTNIPEGISEWQQTTPITGSISGGTQLGVWIGTNCGEPIGEWIKFGYASLTLMPAS
jgi:hypothetical protein